MKVLYSAKAHATGGRDGKVESSDGVIKVNLTKPKGLGGPETPGTTNPEQLQMNLKGIFLGDDRKIVNS